jgi:hypothetical protein
LDFIVDVIFRILFDECFGEDDISALSVSTDRDDVECDRDDEMGDELVYFDYYEDYLADCEVRGDYLDALAVSAVDVVAEGEVEEEDEGSEDETDSVSD